MEIARNEKIKIVGINKLEYEGKVVSVGSLGITIFLEKENKELFFPWSSVLFIIKEKSDIEKLD